MKPIKIIVGAFFGLSGMLLLVFSFSEFKTVGIVVLTISGIVLQRVLG